MSRQFTVDEAVSRYLQQRESNLSDATLHNYQSNLGTFAEWCEETNIESVSDIDQFDVADYQITREAEGLADTTIYNIMMSLRVFIKWCEDMGLLDGISPSIQLPDQGRAARTETIEPEAAEKILEYLKLYEYATMRHAMFALLWDTGMRIGAARSLDLRDFSDEENYVELHHRPKPSNPGGGGDFDQHSGTRLKNGENSERRVNLHPWVTEVLVDYINGRRHDVIDEGRKPLLTTSHGRPARNTMRKRINATTRPCYYTNECPVDGKEMETCEATKYSLAARCPESIPPHSVRRSVITTWLDEGHKKTLVSDRMDVTPDVIDEHYDQRTEEQKRRLRREEFEM